MTRFWLAIAFTAFAFIGHAQCLTDFTKFLPEPSIDYSLDYGRTTAMYDGILAVSAPNSDKSVRLGGVVYLYKKTGNDWIEIGILEPSIPQEGLLFGYSIDMTKDYIVVGANGYGGKVYIFKKPASGWTSVPEIAILSQPNTYQFGSNYRPIGTIDMSQDQQTLVIADPSYWDGYSAGALFIYHKQPEQEWNNSLTPVKILPPENDIDDLGSLGVAVMGNRIIAKTLYAPTGIGAIYIFHDPTGNFTNFQWEARLAPGENYDEGMFWIDGFIVTPDGIFSPAVRTISNESIFGIAYFEMPTSGWINNTNPVMLYPQSGDPKIFLNARLSKSDDSPNEFYASFQTEDRSGRLLKFLKSPTGWATAAKEVIYNPAPVPDILNNYFSSSLASDHNNNVVTGASFIPNSTAQLALTTFSKTPDDQWNSTLLYNADKSTVGHYFGRAVLGFEDYMFVSAPYDGTVKNSGGAVYSYKKVGSAWQKTGKIIPPFAGRYDDVFGTALASNGEYLAVAASGFDPHGKVLLYKKKSSDWSEVELIQEITPADTLNPQASGDNIAMDDQWLIIPAVTMMEGARIHLCIYRFNGTTWDNFQNLELGMANFFARSSTVAVDIENETIVAGGTILQLNAMGKWEPKFLLYPSDPESMRISPDFTHWITNGSMFGYSVDIDGDNIFIGAPTKDDGATWDVGAVYVYTKKPGQNWSSGTETTKLLPRVRDERELFGYSIKALNNTLIVGAPGSDYNKDGVTARNKPGRAYVFQSQDYFWQNVTPLLDFTGDSFVKDYFGMTVNLDITDFFISATIEDNAGDQLSGSVYITPTPPIVKLVPPVCNSEESIDLVGYPFGGVWAGPGIINADEGIFDPKVAGVGVHEFTYQTESCTYLGRLQIEVKAPPLASLLSEPVKYICENGPTSTILQVEEQVDAYYHWYYREKPTDPFEMIDGVSSSIMVSNTGEYQAKVYNETCASFSSIVSVSVESNPIVIGTIPVICEDAITSIPLQASPTGGTWSGGNVSNNAFHAGALPNGNYIVRYNLKSSNQCNHFRAALVKVERIPTLTYSRSSANLCDAGSVSLSLLPNTSNLTFEWQASTHAGVEILQNTTSQITVKDNGTYQAKVSNTYCSRELPPFVVNDQFSISVSPAENELNICSLTPFYIRTNGKPSDSFTWLYSETENENSSTINSNENQLKIEQDGFYQVLVERGVCSFTGEIKHVTIIPGDSLFVPNVFTPNKDGYNDRFQVATLHETIDMVVMNRYGLKIFEGDGIQGWNGDESPTGVYFWQIFYVDCGGSRHSKKGSVHLLR